MAKKTNKNKYNYALEEETEMRRQGVKMRASTWSRFSDESRQQAKKNLRLNLDY